MCLYINKNKGKYMIHFRDLIQLNESFDFEKKSKMLDKYSEGQVQAIINMFSNSYTLEDNLTIMDTYSNNPKMRVKGLAKPLKDFFKKADIVSITPKSLVATKVKIMDGSKELKLKDIESDTDDKILWDIYADFKYQVEYIYLLPIGKTKLNVAIKALQTIDFYGKVGANSLLYGDNYDKREKLVKSGKLVETLKNVIKLIESGDFGKILKGEEAFYAKDIKVSTDSWKIFYER